MGVADLLHDVRVALARLQDVERRLEAMLPPAPEPDDDDDLADHNLIETSFAAARFNWPADSIRRWCREGAGVKRGGRWLASIPRVKRRIAGE